ncbi:MAG: DNA translocase FtsK [Candidatus Nealsonbacteria bacterium]
MARKKRKRRNKNKGLFSIDSVNLSFSLPEETQRHILAIVFFLLSIIFILSYFQKAGIIGEFLFTSLNFLIGKTVFILPFLFFLTGLSFFLAEYKEILRPSFLAILITVLGVSGALERLNPGIKQGGLLGSVLIWPLLQLFGLWVTQILFAAAIIIGVIIFWRLLKRETDTQDADEEEKPSFIRKIFAPSFKVKHIKPVQSSKEQKKSEKEEYLDLKPKKIRQAPINGYELPPVDLLDLTKGKPSAGNIKLNSAIIKNTLESFDIPVEMSEINIGPTVTQYSFKPAEGIKLSKITSLSNDLALALAVHPIRIEAPIPGKSLVGVEVPNKARTFVRLKELLSNPKFQDSPSSLLLCFGSNVSGQTIYNDLAKMPHLLVAGSTGTGKTIFLNNLIISLLYKNSPDVLKFILIDPKRVEFIVYNELPHLLCPVITDSQRATNALKWLTEEMDRRFKALAQSKSKSILSYNEKAFENETEPLPYIVVIIDELADLMASKGREVESAIVRLAQMARAVGVHLIVATQRPSVEVITGLIKANITSRVTFQVASQIDSRTVLDVAGAEKLLGLGDMLFISADNIKPKRIQGAYVSEKEVKRITNWIKTKNNQYIDQEAGLEIEEVQDNLTKALDQTEAGPVENLPVSPFDDPFYEKAKVIVVENKRASASLLQRKLRVGYARAARLIDMLEGNKIIGPSRGAKAREVYLVQESEEYTDGDENEDEGWEQV